MTEDRTLTDTSQDPQPPTPTDVLKEMVNALRTTLMPAPTPQTGSVSPLAMPSSYAGMQLSVVAFSFKWRCISKCSRRNSHQSGRALTWVKAIWNANSLIINYYEAFTSHFKEVFGCATGELSVSDQLLWLRLGTTPINDYTL